MHSLARGRSHRRVHTTLCVVQGLLLVSWASLQLLQHDVAPGAHAVRVGLSAAALGYAAYLLAGAGGRRAAERGARRLDHHAILAPLFIGVVTEQLGLQAGLMLMLVPLSWLCGVAWLSLRAGAAPLDRAAPGSRGAAQATGLSPASRWKPELLPVWLHRTLP